VNANVNPGDPGQMEGPLHGAEGQAGCPAPQEQFLKLRGRRARISRTAL
jgi:hypothetical protein